MAAPVSDSPISSWAEALNSGSTAVYPSVLSFSTDLALLGYTCLPKSAPCNSVLYACTHTMLHPLILHSAVR